MVANDDGASNHDGPTGIPGSRELMSAWPPFVALGLVVAEIGIVMNLVPLSIGGILLFGGSVAGILQDAAMIERPWYALAVVGVLFALFGGGLWWTQLESLALAHVLSVGAANPIAIRGEAILLAGVLLVVGAVAGTVYEPLRNSP
ncbi:cox cluster protein [Halanaeroarchaeum sp. HSR-CO]|nr:cox cluster protein [Halanaeroarchaeum sp. HSR-CO]